MRTRLLLALCFLCLLLPFAAFSQSFDDYTIFSNNSLTLRDRVKIKNGLIGSNTGMQMGYDSTLTGNVRSRGNLIMQDRSTVTGNVTLGGTLTKGSQAKVTGTVTQNASIPSLTIPTIAFSTSTGDVTVGSGETRYLIPAAYGDVVVSGSGNLVLKLGMYSFNTLTLQASATLTLEPDTLVGQVDVSVLSELKIADHALLILGPGVLNPAGARVYSHQTASLSIGPDARIEGVLTLPRAAVTVGDRTTFTGKLRAKAVTLGYDVSINDASLADADADGMPDGWEISNGLNPNVNDAHSDADSDNFDNLMEFTFGTRPKTADTDGDGLKDGAEYTYWCTRGNIQAYSDSDFDGRPNILDPDSDNDGLPDGAELAGWTLIVQGTTKNYVGDPVNPDSDSDGVLDGKEKDGYATDFPNHTIHNVNLTPISGRNEDSDGDGIGFDDEPVYGLNHMDFQTIGTMSDRKYINMVDRMGEWAVSPTTGHLNPQLPSTATCILGAKMGFGDTTTTALSVDRQMEICVFLPQDGQPITLKLDFVDDSGATPDANDKFYNIKYSGAVYPAGTDGAPPITYSGTESNSITWRITDPLYYLKGDYFFNFSYHYDKNNGEKPRQVRLFACYDDGTRVRIEYLTPVNAGTYRSPIHFNLLVAGGSRPAYFRGETAVSSAVASYIDNVKLTDYYGNVVRNVGKKAFNGYWFQYELGKLNAYPGGVSGTSACHRLEFDWVHDATADNNHCSFAIDEVGNKWDDVQITYNAAYKTQDYYCWYGGVARNIAVLRRGTAIGMAATSASLQYADAQVTIKNRAGTDVTSKFTIHKEAGYEDYAAWDGDNQSWRENWIVEAPVTLPVGMYTVTMRNGSAWSASTSFYLILNVTEISLSGADYDDQCYDEDFDGVALDAENDLAGDLVDIYDIGGEDVHIIDMGHCSKTVTDIAVAASDGKKTPFEVRDAVRVSVARIVYGCWEGEKVYTQYGMPVQMLLYSGVTVAEVLAGAVAESHMYVGDCTKFAQLSVAMSRSIGIPGRMVTGKGGIFRPNSAPDPVDGTYKPSTGTWAHVWSEAWMENPPTGADHWYVFDATDFVWTLLGFSASRKQYGALWVDFAGGATVKTCKPAMNVLPFYGP